MEGDVVKIHIHSSNKISKAPLYKNYCIHFSNCCHTKKEEKEMKRKKLHLKITTIIQYIIILLDIFFTQHIYTLGQFFEGFVEKEGWGARQTKRR